MLNERIIDAVVSTTWLQDNLDADDLVVLDIRGEDVYQEGHIPGAVNVPAGEFWDDGELAMMVPEENNLFNLIGNAGITSDSKVVIVGGVPGLGEPPYPLAQATRVASTLIYACIVDVGILDGGFPKWVGEERSTTIDATKVDGVTYEGEIVAGMFIEREYVEEALMRSDSVIVDNRDADVYFGVTIEPFAEKAGHIPTAKSLPAPWMWDEDWSYFDTKILSGMASGVIEENDSAPGEIIVYCGVGGYASSWWYVLTQMLGYENVRIYAGAAQEWVLYNDMVPFRWE